MWVRYLVLVGFFFGVVGVLVALRQPTAPTASAYMPDVTLPENYREELVHFATIDRPDNFSRDIFISPGAAEIVANNDTARLPNGTLIVIEAHRTLGDRRTGLGDNIHAAVKRDDWQASDYQTGERAGAWNYFSFDPETGAISDENVFLCFDCHANNRHIDFLFSRDELIAYGQTGDVQERFCPRPNRLPCN